MHFARLFVCALCFSADAVAEPLEGPVPADVIRVIDGDTIRVRVRVWLDQTVDVSARLVGIDAPELNGADCQAERTRGRRARDAAVTMAGAALILRNIEHDKFAGRVVAEALSIDGVSLSDALLSQGHAVAYGDDTAWCAAG